MIRTTAIFIVLLVCVASAADPEIAKDKRGLQGGFFVHGEAPGKTREEINLSLKHLPSVAKDRPFWLYVPKNYDRKNPAPLLIVLHRRCRLGSFRSNMRHDVSHLPHYAGKDREAWQAIAEKQGFVLAMPLGDVDILWMGLAWHARERTTFFGSLLKQIAKTHAFDARRVYLVATGEGAHAAIATAVRAGDTFAAVAVANPPLFNKAKVGNKIMPEPVPEMLKHASERKVPLLIYAGTADKELKIQSHRVGGVTVSRYQDSSRIPAEHIKTMAKQFKAKGFPVTVKEIPGRHYAPFPAGKTTETWVWLAKHQLPMGSE